MTGVVHSIMPAKGFGFITGSDGVRRFFHVREVKPPSAFDHLHEGKPVTFTPTDTPKGPRAVDVEPC